MVASRWDAIHWFTVSRGLEGRAGEVMYGGDYGDQGYWHWISEDVVPVHEVGRDEGG